MGLFCVFVLFIVYFFVGLGVGGGGRYIGGSGFGWFCFCFVIVMLVGLFGGLVWRVWFFFGESG